MNKLYIGYYVWKMMVKPWRWYWLDVDCTQQEYTEEIERLRRDLLAARERNGVYMAQENYEQITREIELQRKEIVEKLEQIKAMEEEAQRKEETCLQLQQVYEEQQQVLLVRNIIIIVFSFLMLMLICV